MRSVSSHRATSGLQRLLVFDWLSKVRNRPSCWKHSKEEQEAGSPIETALDRESSVLFFCAFTLFLVETQKASIVDSSVGTVAAALFRLCCEEEEEEEEAARRRERSLSPRLICA